VQRAFDNTVIPHIKAGELVGAALTLMSRLAAVPDIPTANESGLPGHEALGRIGPAARKGTPAEVVARINNETVLSMVQPDVAEKLAALGFQSVTNPPEQFTAHVRNTMAKWARVARDAGIKPE